MSKPDITVQALLEQQNTLEREINGFVRDKALEFRKRTGVAISGVSIEMIETQECGKVRPEYHVADTRVHLDVGQR